MIRLCLPPGMIHALRTNPAYQSVLRRLRWDLLPAVFGLSMLALLIYLLVWLFRMIGPALSG